MWKSLTRWRRRRDFLREQSKMQHCSLYVIDDFGLPLPCIPLRVIVPERSILDTLSTSMLDADAIGASVVAALDYVVSEQEASDRGDYEKTKSEFLNGMERFRKAAGVGKRRFESNLEHASITRKK